MSKYQENMYFNQFYAQNLKRSVLEVIKIDLSNDICKIWPSACTCNFDSSNGVLSRKSPFKTKKAARSTAFFAQLRFLNGCNPRRFIGEPLFLTENCEEKQGWIYFTIYDCGYEIIFPSILFCIVCQEIFVRLEFENCDISASSIIGLKKELFRVRNYFFYQFFISSYVCRPFDFILISDCLQ